jgi:hypothetical protein
LKLVKAHLAALVAMEPLEMEPIGAVTLPPLEQTSDEAGIDRDGAALEENRSPIARPGMGPTERGRGPDGKAFCPGAGERWVCPVSKCQDSATHPLDECGGFKSLPVPQRRKVIKDWNRCACCLKDCLIF